MRALPFFVFAVISYLTVELPSVEKREASLKKMLGTVLKDKEKIEQTIEELDRYKRDALKTTWEKVNG